MLGGGTGWSLGDLKGFGLLTLIYWWLCSIKSAFVSTVHSIMPGGETAALFKPRLFAVEKADAFYLDSSVTINVTVHAPWHHSKSSSACGWDQSSWCENIRQGSKCARRWSWHASDTNGKIPAGTFPVILRGRKGTAELPSVWVERQETGIWPVIGDLKGYPLRICYR